MREQRADGAKALGLRVTDLGRPPDESADRLHQRHVPQRCHASLAP